MTKEKNNPSKSSRIISGFYFSFSFGRKKSTKKSAFQETNFFSNDLNGGGSQKECFI